MDPELKAFLEAMEHRIDQRAVVRDAETRRQMDARFAETHKTMDGLRAEMDARFAETHKTMDGLRDEIAEVRRQAGMDRDAIIAEIKALPEAFSTHQRAEADRLDAAREEDMLNHHVLPLEASAANHEKRIAALEKR